MVLNNYVISGCVTIGVALTRYVMVCMYNSIGFYLRINVFILLEHLGDKLSGHM